MVKLTKRFASSKSFTKVINQTTIKVNDLAGYLTKKEFDESVDTLNSMIRIPSGISIEATEDSDSEVVNVTVSGMHRGKDVVVDMEGESIKVVVDSKSVPVSYDKIFRYVNESYSATCFAIMEWILKTYYK